VFGVDTPWRPFGPHRLDTAFGQGRHEIVQDVLAAADKGREAKQHQKTQPARSITRWRRVSSAHLSAPWYRSPSHSTASRVSLCPSTTISMR